MNTENLIQSGKELLLDAKAMTPAVAKIVNDIRAIAHVNGVLTPQHEADFHSLADRFAGYIAKGKLDPLPTVDADGKPLAPLPPLVPPVVTPNVAAVITDAQEAPPAASEVVPTSAEDSAATDLPPAPNGE